MSKRARWLAAGNAAELAIYPGGVHGFTGFPVGIARAANRRQDAFLARALETQVRGVPGKRRGRRTSPAA